MRELVWGSFLVIVTTTVYGPLFEELLYRGLLLGGLSMRYGKVRGLLLSSAFFAAVHFYQGTGALITAAFGLLFGFLYLETGSLVPSIVLHSTWNMLLGLGVTSGAWRIPDWSAAPDYRTVGLVLVGFALAIFAEAWYRAPFPDPSPRLTALKTEWREQESAAILAYKRAQAANKQSGAESETTYQQAYETFRRLHEVNPKHLLGLKMWGLTLVQQAIRKTTEDAARCYEEAEQRFSAATAIAPEDSIMPVLRGSVALRRFALEREPASRAALLAQARRLTEDVLRVHPKHPGALDVRALALYNETRCGAGDSLAETLVDALKNFEAAAQDRAKGLDEILSGWGTILFALANLVGGDAATGLLREAKQKYLECNFQAPAFAAYNLACVCARLGEIEECRTWLERSGEPGRQIRRDEMAVDPDLANVRALGWFEELLQKPL